VAAAAVARALEVEAELANIRAENSDLLARNALLELQAEKMRRAMYGARSERSQRLIDQMELAFVELEETAAEDERLAQIAAARTTTVQGFVRKRTPRSFPDHLPRERVIVAAPEHCPYLGCQQVEVVGAQYILLSPTRAMLRRPNVQQPPLYALFEKEKLSEIKFAARTNLLGRAAQPLLAALILMLPFAPLGRKPPPVVAAPLT
jgi:hypothetical protein